MKNNFILPFIFFFTKFDGNALKINMNNHQYISSLCKLFNKCTLKNVFVCLIAAFDQKYQKLELRTNSKGCFS